ARHPGTVLVDVGAGGFRRLADRYGARLDACGERESRIGTRRFRDDVADVEESPKARGIRVAVAKKRAMVRLLEITRLVIVMRRRSVAGDRFEAQGHCDVVGEPMTRRRFPD